MLLRLYQFLFYLIQPFVWLRLLWRGRKNPAYRQRWAERYGFFKQPIPQQGIVLHSVSVGETLAAIPLVRALQHRYPSLPITITTMTPTGSERVISAFGDSVYHVYLPYDLPCAMRRFLNRLQPRLVIIMETELWPTLINQLHQRHIPIVVANARLSARSALRYQRVKRFTQQLLQQITLIAVQHQDDGQRFLQLGAKQKQLAVTGSLKFDISVSPNLAAKAITLRRQWAADRLVWIAASTHEKEEALLLDVHRRLLNTFTDLLLILVPRHPERFAPVSQLTQQQGFCYQLRSQQLTPTADIQVIIGDTMGELMLLFGIADLAFVGGSLIKRGGHNPLEAAAHAIPILMGPHTDNFTDICQKLQQAGGLIRVQDSDELFTSVTTLLNDEDYRHYCGKHAAQVLHQNQGALKQLLQLIEPFLPVRNH